MNQKICIITCHGFTGYPEEMDPIGTYLAEKGYDWRNLQLPGHGTTPEDLKSKKWTDWTEYVLQEVDICLEKYNNNVIMIGLSLGGALTLYTLIHRPQLKAGICLATPVSILTSLQKILLNIPFLGLWMHNTSNKVDIFDTEMKKNHRSYSKIHSSSGKQVYYVLLNVKKNLEKITTPLLIVQSKKDQVVDYKNAGYIYNNVSSEQKELFYVENSSHVLTKDFDREKIFEKCLEFIQNLD